MVRDGAAGADSGDRVPPSVIGISRRERRAADRGRAALEFGAHAFAALDLLDLLELASHDTHGDVAPPAGVVEDVWVVAGGDLDKLASASRLAVVDWRDLRTAADDVRSRLKERARRRADRPGLRGRADPCVARWAWLGVRDADGAARSDQHGETCWS
jgi:hypothetical protein